MLVIDMQFAGRGWSDPVQFRRPAVVSSAYWSDSRRAYNSHLPRCSIRTHHFHPRSARHISCLHRLFPAI